jgi:hypothetical protein
MKGRKQEATYAARTIRSFLEGSCGDRDWDDFTSCSLSDPEVEGIRRSALAVDLPVDDEGQSKLLALADEAGRLATADGG